MSSVATVSSRSGFPTSILDSTLETASSLAEVQTALSALHILEYTHPSALDSRTNLAHELFHLDSLRGALHAQASAVRSVSNPVLANAANTADQLSRSVHALVLEQSRVEETLRAVEQSVELKACVAGVVRSMGELQDWEAAAGYIARADRIPDEIVRSEFANAMVPTIEAPEAPFVTLESARESLCGLLLRKFEEAVRDGDTTSITRFFKLFPLIGRASVGLDAYGRYVRRGVADSASVVLKEGTIAGGRKAGSFHLVALTKLFEHIAQIVDGHEDLVETHYGKGSMVKVIERLQSEADVQGSIILDLWSEERAVDRRIANVKKGHPFSLQGQGFRPSSKRISGDPTPRPSSPAIPSGSGNPRNYEDEGVHMKEVDLLLIEMAAMLNRWSLYSRFIAGKCLDPQTPEDAPLTVPDVLITSKLHQKISGKLIGSYNLLSSFFFKRSIEKAFQLDESPRGLSLKMSDHINSNPPYIIAAVDDIMYIAKVVIQRSVSTSHRAVIESVISTIARALDYDFVGRLQRKMYDESLSKPAAQGVFSQEDKIISYMILINSLDMANEYLARVASSFLGTSVDRPESTLTTSSSLLRESLPFHKDAASVSNALSSLRASFASKTTELRGNGIQVLFNHVVKPRLRSVLNDAFHNADYKLSEQEFIELVTASDNIEGHQDEVCRRFEHGWDTILKPIGRILTPRAFAALLDITAKDLSVMLEKRVWSYAGLTSADGAIRMERDLRGIVGVVARGKYALREVFGKTIQILTVANMEVEEWEYLLREEGGGEGMVWLLNEEEKRRARKLVRI